ncbi:hypothetical protein [Lacticaseibacillus absianus]|uniref:hypothetical protein n=1 Tax=Lacticaseibacillus absianus TaxID=2729623 RepID=UPI0015CC815A|nr:hypothetical protein [Lacticaseibacillus absianus]
MWQRGFTMSIQSLKVLNVSTISGPPAGHRLFEAAVVLTHRAPVVQLADQVV